jgi:hypothetical protein
MYESPVEAIATEMQMQIINQHENAIYQAVQKYDITVDKKELMRALQYDRQQYEKGYKDAVNDIVNMLEELSKEYPYKVVSIYDTYSQYNEAWQDAIDRAIGVIRGGNYGG